VATVVEAHRGAIECLEEEGGGACFRITLERIDEESEADAPARAEKTLQGQGGER